MKMRIFIISILTFCFSSLLAQEFSHEFGKCTKDELQMQYYSKDSTAEAVVIYDIGRSYFKIDESGTNLIFEKSTKIKIFTKAGIDFAQFQIPYYSENGKYETILEIEGNTYNLENGAVRQTPLESSNSFDSKGTEGWLIKKIALPDVKVGSVIELKYKLSSPFFFKFRSWEFQTKIPVMYSEYRTMMIPFYSYRYIFQGINRLSDFQQYKDAESKQLGAYTWRDQVYVFMMKDIPAFRDESFISAPEDYIMKIEFQLTEYINTLGTKQKIMTTWPKLVSELLDHPNFGDYIKSAQKQASKITDTMQLQALNTEQKAEKIFRYVKLNFSWNNQFSKYSTGTAKEFLKTKEGNCSDINLFLTGMLRATGIDATPVIISSRGNGKIRSDYPFTKFFDYVIVAVSIDGQYVLLDATEPLCNFGMLPTRCFNDAGLVVKKGAEAEWINFSSAMLSSISYNFDLIPKIDKDSIEGKFKIISSGYDALEYRKNYINSPFNFKEKIVQNILSLIDSVKIENLNNTEKLFSVSFDANGGIDQIDEKILIPPFMGYAINDNPFKQPSRVYPIDMIFKRRRTYMSTIHIPEGYKVYSAPKNLTIDNDDIKIVYELVNYNEQVISVLGTYEFKKDVYKASSYIDLKNYYKTIIDKFNERVVIAKVSN